MRLGKNMATKAISVKTIQLWPSGNSVTYSVTEAGEYHLHESKAPCTVEDVRTAELAEHYMGSSVWCCDSSLVEDLIKKGFDGFSWDDIENQYPDVDGMDADEVLAFVLDYCSNAEIEGLTEGDLRDKAQDLATENPREIFEWWRVDPWLCARLREEGQPVIDNDYGCWWGRTCFGQDMITDGTLQAIARAQLHKA